MIFKILLGILPFIMPYSQLGENLSALILFLTGSIFIIKYKNKIKEDKYFYLLIILWTLIFITQIFISPYLESLSGTFNFLNICIYYQIYAYIFNGKNKDTILKYGVFSISILCLIYIIIQGLYLNIRIYGNIRYANSYSLLLLLGIYLNKIRKDDKFTNIIESLLILGILFTGSRTTIALLLIYIIFKVFIDLREYRISIITSLEPLILGSIQYIICDKLKILSIMIIPLFLILYNMIKGLKCKNKIYCSLGIVLVVVLFFNDSNTVQRLKNISLENGSLQERLVFFEDSIKAILSNPLGNGINMFQYKLYDNATAFYDVKYIHNSILQVIYDVGVINGLIFIVMIVLGGVEVYKSKDKNKYYLLLVYISILLHSLLDFDFSFSTFTIALVMIVSLGRETKKEKSKEDKKIIVNKYIYLILTILSTYLLIFEGSIAMGRAFADNNNNLSNKIFNISGKLSLNKDYRSFFYQAQVNKDMYDETSNEDYVYKAINLLEKSKDINPYDPMVIWNLSYLYETLGEDEKALSYGEEVIDREGFYPEVYVKQYDYLMRLYGETADKKYEDKIKDLESTYYKNYENLNKRAKYMNNQLQENFDDIRDKNIDYNMLLNGKYENEVKYFNQEDEKWVSFPYKTNDNLLGKTGCGVTAMAMIESTMKDKGIIPIEMAEFSIENGYCNNNTEVEFLIM